MSLVHQHFNNSKRLIFAVYIHSVQYLIIQKESSIPLGLLTVLTEYLSIWNCQFVWRKLMIKHMIYAIWGSLFSIKNSHDYWNKPIFPKSRVIKTTKSVRNTNLKDRLRLIKSLKRWEARWQNWGQWCFLKAKNFVIWILITP